MKQLAPGEAIGHTERWQLFPIQGIPETNDEAALARWLAPLISNISFV